MNCTSVAVPAATAYTGVATGASVLEAYERALACDPVSAFGGIIALNRPVDVDTACAIMDPKAKRFVECIVAPEYDWDDYKGVDVTGKTLVMLVITVALTPLVVGLPPFLPRVARRSHWR